MGLIAETLRDTLRIGRKAGLALPQGGNWLIPRGYIAGERDYRVDVGDGSGSSLVSIVVGWHMTVFPEAPVMLQKRVKGGDPEPMDDHPFLDVLKRPNPYFSGIAMAMATDMSFLLDGNAYLLKERNGSGRIQHLWYAPHWMVEPKWLPESGNFIDYYSYQPGGTAGEIRLPPSEVVHFRFGLDPQNVRKGYSRLKALVREIYTDEEAARFAASMLRNAGVPGLIVSPAATDISSAPSRDDLETTKIELLQRTTGDRRGEPLVFPVATNVEQFGFSPAELDLSAMRAIPESRVAAALNVPAAVVGFLAGLEQTKVGATMRELRELAYESGVIPVQRLMAEDFRNQLLDDYVDDVNQYIVGFDYSQVRVLQEDTNAFSERTREEFKAGVITRGEARNTLGHDVQPADDIFLVPISVMEVPRGERMQRPEPAAPQAPGQEDHDEQPKGRKGAKTGTPADQALMRLLRRQLRQVENAWSPNLVTLFDDLGQRAATAYLGAKAAKRAGEDPEDIEVVARIISALGVGQAWQQSTLGPQFLRYYSVVGELTYQAASLRLGIDMAFNIADPLARQVLQEGGRRVGLLDVQGDTRDALFRALRDSRAAGDGADAVARRIRQYVPEGRLPGEADCAF
jgi:HK97 family phage portal protein